MASKIPPNHFSNDPDLNMDPNPPSTTATPAFRSSSALDPSQTKRQRVEAPDSKTRAVAGPIFRDFASSSSSSSNSLPPPPMRAIYPRPSPMMRGAPRPPRASAAAAAPDEAPQSSCVYQTATKQIDSQFTETGLSRTFKVGQEKQPITSLGKGTSFQCYKFGDDRVIKFFVNFFDTAQGRKQSNKSSKYDARMDFLKKNFELCKILDIASAEILNPDTLKTDGYILQRYVEPLKLSWDQGSGDLTEAQTAVLNQFLSLIKKAFVHHKSNCWDLNPKNFGFVDNQIVLFDFSDQPMELNQWLQFPQAIREWANNNPSAEQMIVAHLTNYLDEPTLAHVKANIQTLIGTLGWQQQE